MINVVPYIILVLFGQNHFLQAMIDNQGASLLPTINIIIEVYDSNLR